MAKLNNTPGQNPGFHRDLIQIIQKNIVSFYLMKMMHFWIFRSEAYGQLAISGFLGSVCIFALSQLRTTGGRESEFSMAKVKNRPLDPLHFLFW